MPKHRVSLPPTAWPADLRALFESRVRPLSPHQRRRFQGAFGRWLKNARDEGLPPDLVSVELWRARTSSLSRDRRNVVRQALALVFPDKRAELFAPGGPRKGVRSEREKLAALVERNLEHWPADWRAAAGPLLKVDPDGTDDGILVQAWSLETIQGRVEYVSAHFGFCRKKKLPEDISPETVRANLRDRQRRYMAGELRIGGSAIYLARLADFATTVRPDRSWDWLRKARDRFGKIAAHYPSRNEGRVVEIVELRLAALKLMKIARRLRDRARIQRQCVEAHTLARTALGMLLLSEAPIRVGSLAAIEIGLQITGDFRTIRLAPHETKEGESDQRRLSDVTVRVIAEYVGLHRTVVAPAEELRLFVGARGLPLSGDALSRNIGDFCERKFKTRATAHPIRNSVGGFIVSEAPEEAGLVTTILNHGSHRTTAPYVGTAHQVVAGQVLRQAITATATVGAVRLGRVNKKKAARPRSLRMELAERAAARERCRPT